MSATAPDDVTTRVAVLEHIARDTRDALGRIEQRLDRMEGRIEQRLDRMDGRIDALGRDGRTDFRLLITLGVGGFATLLGAIAHGFRWL